MPQNSGDTPRNTLGGKSNILRNSMFKMVGQSGAEKYSWIFKPGKYRIGRGQDCELVVMDMTISRQHAEFLIKENNDHFELTDLGSHNGTFLNGNKINGTVQVKMGDNLAFGSMDFKVVDSAEPEVKPQHVAAFSDSSQTNLLKSMVLPFDEASKPLPAHISDLPQVIAAVFEMAKMLVLPGPKEQILDQSLELVSRVVPAERLAILLKDDSELGVSIASTYIMAGKDLGCFSLSRTIVKDIISNRNSIVINDIQQTPRFAQQLSIVSLGMKSAMAVPLFDDGEMLGILYIDTSNPIHRYNDDSLRLLSTFGNLIASRLLNYSLLEERQHRRLMEAELERAASIQKSLLPPSLPEVPGYRIYAFQEQSQQVGGDFYDAAILPDKRLVLIVGDVSGKGMGAALLMSDIIGSFRVLFHDPHFDLIRAVEIVSKELCRHSAQDNYATLFIATLDPQNHLLEYVNAGHNPPLLLKNYLEIEHLPASGIMVGAFEGVPWEKRQIMINNGDMVLLYTDGVTEARYIEELYGEQRLEKVYSENGHLSPRDIIRFIKDNIDDFIKGTPLSDDITMLVLRRLDGH